MEKRVSTSDMSETQKPSDPEPPISSRLLPMVMASALFMDLLDTSALGAALPTLARQFHTSPIELKFALTAYLMTMAAFVPASGWLAERYGPRRVFLNAVKIYLLGSLCCGLSNSVTMLISARVLQGIGGALMTPVARLIVVASTPRSRLVYAMNAFTMPAVLGPLMGPVLAGVLLEVASWRWIFFINLPVGIVGIFAVLRIVPRLRYPHPGRFDSLGFLLAALTIMALVMLSESIGTGLLSTRTQIVLIVVGIAAGAIFVYHATRSKNPMLDMRLLSIATYRASMIGGSLMRFGVSATPFLLPLLFQVGLGWSPVRAGFVMTGLMLGSIIARVGGTYAIRVMGFKTTLIVTAFTTALLTMTPATFRNDTSAVLIVTILMSGGFFRAAHFVAAQALAYADVPPERISKASTLSTVIQQISLGFGISISGFTLYLSAGETRQLTVQDFMLSFMVLGVVTMLAIPSYLGLNRDVGENMQDRRVT